MDEPNGAWKPPYFAFQTFWSFMADLAAKPLPPKIDRSLLKSKSGTDQANLLMALRAFDLMDDTNTVNGSSLAPIAQGAEESRAHALADLVKRYYGKPLELSEQSGTEGQLHELFRDNFALSSADTRRKAVTFFLHAARRAGMPLSEHFPSTRSGSGAPGTPKVKRSPTAAKRKSMSPVGSAKTPVVTTEQTASGEHKRVSFGDSGLVTVNVDVKWLDLPEHVFTGLRKVIRDLEALGSDNDSPRQPAAGAAATGPEVAAS